MPYSIASFLARRAFRPTLWPTLGLIALVAATATLLIAWGIYVSKFGAGLFAIHDDEDAAEVMGVPTYRYKLMALAISCALAGVAGGIHALFLSYVTAGEVFTITVPLTILAFNGKVTLLVVPWMVRSPTALTSTSLPSAASAPSSIGDVSLKVAWGN